ncbi:MAG: O-antigen ligase family protein [Clostridia bacterium]|nr:O-antigen ligase family protein [Clostridia bacterium]
MKMKKDTSTVDFVSVLKGFIYCLVFIVIFYPPFIRGLFFDEEIFPTEVFVLLLFAIYWIYKSLKKDKKFLQTPLEYGTFLLTVIYFISIFVSANIHLAVSEWLKYVMYFSVFFILSDIINSYKSKMRVLGVMVAATVGVCILGFDGATGGSIASVFNSIFSGLGLRIKFFDLYVNNRMTASIQYPNALASYLMAVFFIVMPISIYTVSKLKRTVSFIVCTFILVTFLLTLSRGAFLFLPVAAFIFILLLPKGFRVRGFINVAIIAIVSSSIAVLEYMNISGTREKALIIWLVLLLGLGISAVFSAISDKVIAWFEHLNWKVYLCGVITLCLLGFAAIIYVLNAYEPMQVSETVKKSIVLEPGSRYKLLYDIDAKNNSGNAYTVRLTAQKETDIIFGEEKQLVNMVGKNTNGRETREVTFFVPNGLKIVNIYFSSSDTNQAAILNNARIIEKDSGKTVKSIPMKHRFLPDNIASRFENLSVSKSAIERKIFYGDAFKILKDNLILGAGGGAWFILHPSYQSYSYSTTETHNYYLQLALETGAIGFVIILFIIVSLIAMFLREYRYTMKSDFKERILQTGIFTAIIAMLMHAIIDWDLSMSAVSLLLWELMALFNSRYRNGREDRELMYKKNFVNNILSVISRAQRFKIIQVYPVIGIVLALVILIIPFRFNMGFIFGKEAALASVNNDSQRAFDYMKRAVAADPLMDGYRIDYANLLVTKKDVTQKDIDLAIEQAEGAEKYGKYKLDVINKLGTFYLFINQVEKGLSFFDYGNKLAPLDINQWEKRIDTYKKVALYNFSQNNNQNAVQVIDRMKHIFDDAVKANKSNLNPFIFSAQSMEAYEKLKYIKDNLGKQNFIDYEKIKLYNVFDLDINSDGVPDQWNIKKDSNIKTINDFKSFNIEIPDNNETYISTRGLGLLPNKTYNINANIQTGSQSLQIPFTIDGATDVSGFLSQSVGTTYTASFKTPNNITQYDVSLKLIIKGKFKLSNISIIEQ